MNQIAPNQCDAWLKSEAKWKNRIGPISANDWEGVRCLGIGSFGLVCPWQRKPDPSASIILSTSKPQNASERVNKVVVKQTASRAVEFLKQEGYFLKVLKGTGVKHFGRIYRM